MTAEDRFLAQIASRLGRPAPLTAPPARPARSQRQHFGLMGAAALADRFQAEAEQVGARVHRAADRASVGPLVTSVLQQAAEGAPGAKQAAGGTVLRWDDPRLDDLGLEPALAAAGFTLAPFGNNSMMAASHAVAGITGCDWAVAETGTMVLKSAPFAGARPRGRVVSLLPPLHIAIVFTSQLTYSMLEVLQALQADPLPAQVIFATGPSRSADIENDLSIGVHGPKEVHIILVAG